MGRFLYKLIHWPHNRGSWQWDISCLVFLVIIFATPQEFLEEFTRNPLTSAGIHQRLLAFFGDFQP